MDDEFEMKILVMSLQFLIDALMDTAKLADTHELFFKRHHTQIMKLLIYYDNHTNIYYY